MANSVDKYNTEDNRYGNAVIVVKPHSESGQSRLGAERTAQQNNTVCTVTYSSRGS